MGIFCGLSVDNTSVLETAVRNENTNDHSQLDEAVHVAHQHQTFVKGISVPKVTFSHISVNVGHKIVVNQITTRVCCPIGERSLYDSD